jgi:hypothetical protein
VRAGVRTKVLMLSATPVNNRFNDLKNQLALAYEGTPELIDEKLNTSKSIDEIFRQAQTAFNAWSKLPMEARSTDSLLKRWTLISLKCLILLRLPAPESISRSITTQRNRQISGET